MATRGTYGEGQQQEVEVGILLRSEQSLHGMFTSLCLLITKIFFFVIKNVVALILGTKILEYRRL